MVSLTPTHLAAHHKGVPGLTDERYLPAPASLAYLPSSSLRGNLVHDTVAVGFHDFIREYAFRSWEYATCILTHWDFPESLDRNGSNMGSIACLRQFLVP